MGNSKTNNIAKQGAILATAGLFVRFLGFLYRVPITSMIGDRGNGIYASSYYVYTLFLVMSSAGLPAAISKMVAERIAYAKYREAHKIFRVSFYFAAFVGSVCMFILFFGASWFDRNNDGSRYGLMSLAPTVLIVSIMAVFRGYFQGMKNSVPTAISQIIEQVLNALFSVILCYLLLHAAFSANMIGGSVSMGAAGSTMGTGIGALAGLLTLLYIYKNKKKNIISNVARDNSSTNTNYFILKELMHTAIPIIAGAAVFSFTNFIDMFMVQSRVEAGGFTHDQAVALYGQLAGKYLTITALPISVSTSLATASIPEIAESMKKKDTVTANKKINLAIKLTMVISFPAAIGIAVLGDPIIRFLFPNNPDGGILLQVGAISIIFLSLTQILGGMLQGISRFYIPVFAAVCGAIVKIVLNYNLTAIPKLNVVGAVIGTIFCFLVASIINYYFLEKITHAKIDFVGIFVKPALASTVMGLIVYCSYYLALDIFFNNAIGIFCSVCVGSVTYFVFLYLINGITNNEIRQLPGGRHLEKFLI